MRVHLAVSLAASPLALAGPFVAENIGPNPDTLVAFDTAEPGANSPTSPVATLAGNFIRGLDMDSARTGYYVATSTLTGSPTGFYRLNDDGSSTLIAPLPALGTAEGGLTLNRDGTMLYMSLGAAGSDPLYTITPDGVFTLVGPITLPGGETAAVLGLAVDPATGVLYAAETTTDSLYTIDPTTAVATLVGPFGVSINAIGGLDFDGADGSLIFAGNSGDTDIFRLDITTGAATLLGSLGFGSSSIASLTFGPTRCTADVDDGSGTGTPDGAVTIDDLLYYLGLFESGVVAADVDNGTFTGVLDGAVTIDDLLYYLFRFEAGC